MNVWKKVAAVRGPDKVEEALHWDGRKGFMLAAAVPAMGQTVEITMFADEAKETLSRWSQLDRLDDDFNVTYADEEALDKIMEGEEWHPLKAVHRG